MIPRYSTLQSYITTNACVYIACVRNKLHIEFLKYVETITVTRRMPPNKITTISNQILAKIIVQNE